MAATDFILDTNGAPVVANADFVVGDSDAQHVVDIMVSSPGDWKRSPLVGVGMYGYINSPNTVSLRTKLARIVRLQLESDGYQVGQVQLDDISNPKITASRGS